MNMNLKDVKILVVGVGGLGCPASLALAEAGIGTLGLMDPDVVELSNLHRQILYSEADLGQLKVEAAQRCLKQLFPETGINVISEAFGAANAEAIFENYDLIIDGLDRLEKKFVLNDWCVKLGKPFVHAGVVKFEGQVLPVIPGQTACLRCLIPKIPPPFALPTCREAGVLGSFSQAIGYLQAYEALRLLNNPNELFLWKWDIQKRTARSIRPVRNTECEACGKKVFQETIEVKVNCEV
jgi:molybdopterin/thiamine biosynthesis adenylyltransferase